MAGLPLALRAARHGRVAFVERQTTSERPMVTIAVSDAPSRYRKT